MPEKATPTAAPAPEPAPPSVETVVMAAARPWSIGRGAGLSRDYHFTPGAPVDVAIRDTSLLRRLAGPGRTFVRPD